jgi:hypothetical protein
MAKQTTIVIVTEFTRGSIPRHRIAAPTQGRVPFRAASTDRFEEPACRLEDLVDPGPTDTVPEGLPSVDPLIRILVAEMPAVIAVDQSACGLAIRQQVVNAGHVLAWGHERRQRRIVQSE